LHAISFNIKKNYTETKTLNPSIAEIKDSLFIKKIENISNHKNKVLGKLPENLSGTRM